MATNYMLKFGSTEGMFQTEGDKCPFCPEILITNVRMNTALAQILS